MGGLIGHIYHIYDNPDLTFGEIKEVLQNAAQGTLEKASEKLDGANLVFTYRPSGGGLAVARAASDIKNGGMSGGDLARKFAGRQNISEAFNSAFDVLSRAITSLPKIVTKKIFCEGATELWYSMEVIHPGASNVINYDCNSLVFHEWPVFKYDGLSIERLDESAGGQLLKNSIASMQAAVTSRSWRLAAPTISTMKKISDGTLLQKTLRRLEETMSTNEINDSDTIQDYMVYALKEQASRFPVGNVVITAIATRVAGVEGSPTLTKIKEMVKPELRENVRQFVLDETARRREAIMPVEMIINDFAIELLRGMQSTLVANGKDEVKRIKKAILEASRLIESSGNGVAMDILRREMKKLGSIDNIASPVEGIVFKYNGSMYKFTGAWASANQILGLLKYGRKGVDPSEFRGS